MTASSTIPLRVGIAGAVRGGGFLDGLRSLGADRAVLAAVYDPDIAVRERFASAHGVATSCDSFEELLDASDLVVLSTPQHHHAPQAIVALERGITRDLYVALGEPLGAGAWALRVHVKPFVRWIWAGALLMALGGLVTATDRRFRTVARKELA